MSKQTLKTGWRMVKFGDVVRNAKLVERDPIGAGIERIVGIEHIEPEDLHIRSWNNPEDGTSFTRKFVSGQTLFVKRRAYQRKLGYAEFDGICSGDILTFETKDPKVLLPELLPFICQTDSFFDHALGTSAGSLSPRTSFKAIKDFEFPLPPIPEQKRISEILWASDEAMEGFFKALNNERKVKRKIEDDVFIYKERKKSIFNQSSWEQVRFDQIANICRGVSWSKTQECVDHNANTVGVIKIPNIQDKLDLSDLLYLTGIDIEKRKKYSARKGWSIMICSNGNPDRVGNCVYIKEKNELLFASFLIGIHSKVNQLTDEFLYRFLRGPYVQHKITSSVQGSTGLRNISLKMLKKLDLKLPPPEIQNNIVILLDEIDEKMSETENHINSLRDIQRLITQKALEATHV